MRRLLLSVLAFGCLTTAEAATVITGTIVLTNNVGITGELGESITVNGDTRTWTNAVYDAGTQMLVGTNLSQSAQYLLQHLSAYPFTGLTLGGDGSSTITLRSAVDGALAVTIYPTDWGYVSYTTNTLGSGQVVRIPFGLESTAVKQQIASGLADAVNSTSNTNGLYANKLTNWATAAADTNVASGFATVLNSAANTNGVDANKLTGLAALSPVWTGGHTFTRSITQSMVTNSLETTNCIVSFLYPLQTFDAGGDFQLLQSTNRPSASTNTVSTVLLVNNISGTNITAALNTAPGWKVISGTTFPLTISTNDTVLFQFLARGASETNVLLKVDTFH